MLDYENQRKLIIVFILAVVVVIILTVLALILIWAPKNEAEDDNSFKVGIINRTKANEENIVKKYYSDLYIMFLNGDMNKIYELTGKDYLEFSNLDKESLMNLLLQKGVLGKQLDMVKYTNYLVPGYNNVYDLYLKVKDEAYSVNVTIRETSPQNYTIAFDMFIDYNKDVYKATVDSIEMNILKLVRYTNSVQFELTLRNTYDKTITINEKGSGNPIMLVSTSNNVKNSIMNNISVSRVTINSKEKTSCTLVYNIDEIDDYYLFNKLVVKDVKFENLNGTKNIEFILK